MNEADRPVAAFARRLADSSLRRHYAVALVLVSGVLVFVAMATAASAVWTSLRVVDHSERILALEVANRDVMQDMTDAETGLHGYALTGNEASFLPYELAMNWLPQDLQRLADLAEGHPDLAAAVALQEDAARRWLQRYAERWLEVDRGGTGLPEDARLYATGARLFDQFRAANEQVDEEIEVVTAEIRQQTRRYLVLGLLTGVLVSVIATACVVALARRLSRLVVEPLTALNGSSTGCARGTPRRGRRSGDRRRCAGSPRRSTTSPRRTCAVATRRARCWRGSPSWTGSATTWCPRSPTSSAPR